MGVEGVVLLVHGWRVMRELINRIPYVHVTHYHMWRWLWRQGWQLVRRGKSPRGWWYGRFKAHPNPELQRRRPRWGFCVLGLDIGSRG